MKTKPMPELTEWERTEWILRIVDRIEFQPDGCWIYKGTTSNYGHCRVTFKGFSTSAHRAIYCLVVEDVPTDLVVDHLCRVPACVNPDHLEPVTPWENVRRGDAPTAIHARKTHCIHGHPFDEANTYIVPKGGRKCRACDIANYHRRKAARA